MNERERVRETEREGEGRGRERERHTQRCVHTCLDSAFDHTDKCQRTARLSKLLLAPQHSTTAFFCPKVSLSVTHTHTHTHTKTDIRT